MRANNYYVSKRSSPRVPRCFFRCLNEFFILCVGLRVNAMAEAKRIQCRLNSLNDNAAGTAHPFWSDRGRGFTLATLQDRAGQASTFVETCRATLEKIHHALFPLDETPQELVALL